MSTKKEEKIEEVKEVVDVEKVEEKKEEVKEVKEEKKEVKKVQPKKEVKEVKEKIEVLKNKSYCGIKINSISKREDGAYDLSLADNTTTIITEVQYKINVI